MYVEENPQIGLQSERVSFSREQVKSNAVNNRTDKNLGPAGADNPDLEFFAKLAEQDVGTVRPSALLSGKDTDSRSVTLSILDGDRFDKDIFVKHLRAIVVYCREHGLVVDYKSQNKLCAAFGLPSQVYGDGRMDIDDTVEAVIELVMKSGADTTVRLSRTSLMEPGVQRDQILQSSRSFVEREMSNSTSARALHVPVLEEDDE